MTAVKKWARKALLSKIESVYATDPTPSGAANAIEAHNVTFRRLSTLLPRPYAKPTLGRNGEIEALVHAQLTFDVPVASSGAAGTAPAWAPLLRACAMAETLTGDPADAAEYALVATGEASITHYWQMDGIKAELNGARGTAGIEFVHGQVPMWKFDFMGLHPAQADTALPTPTMTAWQRPKAASKVNTPTFTLNGVALKLHSLSVNLGIDRVLRDFTNHAEIVVTGRDNGVRGELVFFTEALGTFNPFALAAAESLHALQIIHGVGAGNIVQLDAPKVQILQPNHDVVQGMAVIRCALLLNEDEGNDEILITAK